MAHVPVLLALPDLAALHDLETFVTRARFVDPDGAVRLVGHGETLAVYVSPVHGSGGPTVVGLRTVALAVASQVDVTVPLVALVDRFARLAREAAVPVAGEPVSLPVPPVQVSDAGWAGMSPPRRGWQRVATLGAARLLEAAREGAAEIAQGAPAGSGAQAVARLRARVWARELVTEADGVPLGLAFAADALGFLASPGSSEPEALGIFRCGQWVRLATERGHVLARPALL